MMKRFLAALLVALVFLGSSASALVMPEELYPLFSAESWAGWSLVTMDEHCLQGSGGAFAAVLMRKAERNVLCILRETESGYVTDVLSDRAVYAGEAIPTMAFDDSGQLLTYTYQQGARDLTETYTLQRIDGLWRLVNVSFTGTEDRTITFGRMSMSFSDPLSGQVQRVYGKLRQKLNNFDINQYPRTYEEAMEALQAPQYPEEGRQQDPLPDGVPVSLAHTGEFAVITGPSERYATVEDVAVGPETELNLLGLEGNYAFVSYANGDDAPRYGYIAENALEQSQEADALPFDWLRAELREDASLTDSPQSAEALVELAAGTEAFYLATLGSDWSYIEVGGRMPLRGFVPSSALNVHYDLNTWETDAEKPVAIVSRDVDVVDDPYRRSAMQTLVTLSSGSLVYQLDILYGGWGYIEVEEAGQTIRGFILLDALETAGEGDPATE